MRSLILTLSACLWIPCLALVPDSQKTRLTHGWEFIRGDMGGIWEVMRPVPGKGKPEAVPLWDSVDLPHCFNAEDCVDPDVNYYQGPAWYRTSIDIANPYESGHTFLEFEGAGQATDVFVYTRHVGRHVGGYDEWSVDITDAVEEFLKNDEASRRFGGKVPIAVRCDNSRNVQAIPSDMSDFNLYGGLYRYVNLAYLPKSYPGMPEINASLADNGEVGDVDVTVPVEGEGQGSIKVTLLSPEGKVVGQSSSSLSAGDNTVFKFKVGRPRQWSPASPALYSCRIKWASGDDSVVDSRRFGFRNFRFEEKGPFFLNGKRLLLRGTHRHEDHAGVAAAMTEEMMRREMRQIKDMGANFIRLGHYQQSSIILDLCDQLGILVWEEIPWCRGGLGGEDYKDMGRRMLRNMISQHSNHPSVILWGLGNENDWPGDFEEFDKSRIRDYMSELNGLAHSLDPSRNTVIRRCDFCKDIVDVYSPSIWAGWYSRNFRDFFEMERGGYLSVPRFIHAEWGGDSHAGRHAEERSPGGADVFNIEAADRNGDWSESYIVRLYDWHLKEQEKMPWLTGSAFWTFKDFSTPLRPDNPIPYVNQKGVVQRDGTPKESYYVFQSYWSESPMVHIYGHSWPMRWGEPNEKKEVLVYSNCPEVELFVNGVSQGKRLRDSESFPAAGLHWNVTLRPGDNEIRALAMDGDTVLEDCIHQAYQVGEWGAPAEIRIGQTNDKDGILLTAEIVDAEGQRCLDASDFIEFGCTDSKRLIINQGTSMGSRRVQASNGVATIRMRRAEGPCAVSATCPGRGLVSTHVLR